jgi:integrase
MTTHRGHGEGTVYHRTAQDDYCAQITLPNGKRRTIGYAKTKRDAQKKLRAAQMLLEQGKLSFETNRGTVGQHLQQWLETVAKPSVTYHTYEAYEICVRRRLVPLLGEIKLRDLRPQHIQNAYAELSKTLQPKSIRLTHVPLNQALNLAVEWNLIPNNPAARVKLPKIKGKEKTILTPEQVTQLLAATRHERLYPLWYLFVSTGARKGEILGLKWADVNFKTGNLSIRRQIIRKTGIGLVLEELKTEKSRRTIPLGPDMLSTLREHRTRKLEERLASERWETRPEFEDLLFSSVHGSPLDPATTWADFQKTLAQAGLPPMTLHGLRDTAATCMLLEGIDAKTIAERLGHSDVALTLRIYSHVTPAMHRDAAERLERLYGQS